MTLVSTGRIMALLLAATLVTACGGGATSGGIGGGGGGGGLNSIAFLSNLVLSCDAAVGSAAQCNNLRLIFPDDPPDVDTGFLPGAAQDDFTDYTSQQGALVDAITVTPTAANVNATITVNGVAVPTGQASPPLPLEAGENVIDIVVTAVDGVTQVTYSLFVTRLPDNLTELTALSLSSGTLAPAFAREVTSYSAAVANTISTVQVTATTREPAATITVNGNPATSGAPSGNVPMTVGENEIEVLVTAVDGTTTQSYVIDVTRIGNANLSTPLLLVGVPGEDGGEPVQLSLNANFDPANRTAYNVNVESRIESVIVIPNVDPTRVTEGVTITVNDEPVLAGDPSEPFVLGEDPEENRIRIVVTHPFSGEEEPLTRTYTLTIIRQDPPLFEPEAWLKPSVAGERLAHGNAIALSADGETMAVGAHGVLFDINLDDDEQERFAGSVYVYARDGLGDWQEQSLIVPFNSEEEDRFGFSVTLSADGNRLAIGAPRESGGANGQDGPFTDINAIPPVDPIAESGAVYTYVRTGGAWAFESYIKSPFPGEGYRFGHSVALSGDGLILAIGESGEASDLSGVTDTAAFLPIEVEETDSGGAVHVYVDGQDGVAPWTPNAVIKAPTRIEGFTTHTGTLFGSAVTLTSDGGLLAIGMAGEDSNATSIDSVQTGTGIRTESGAVYLHAREAGSWSDEPTYIKTRVEVPRNGHHFGHSLALSAAGDALAVGAPGHFNNSRGIFTGFTGEGGGSTTGNSGAVYLFRVLDDAWQQEVFIKAPNSLINFRFGESLAMSADGARVVIGAPGEASTATTVDGNMLLATAPGSGAAYTYVRDDEADSGWVQSAYLKVPNSRVGIRFGSAVAMSADGELIAGGAPGERSAAQGVLMGTDNLPEDNSFDRRGAAYTFLAVPPPEDPDPEPEPEPEPDPDPEPPGDED